MSDKTLLIKNIAQLYTGSGFLKTDGRQPTAEDLGQLKNADLRCDSHSGTILEIGTHLKTQSDEQVFDATGLLATPAWVDSHTHTIFGGERSQEFFLRWTGETYQTISKRGGGIHNTVRDTHAQSDDELSATLKKRLGNMLRDGTGFVEVKTGYSESAEQELRLLRLLKAFRQSTASDKSIPQISPTFLALHAIPKHKTEFDFVQEMIAILPTVAKESLADHVDAFPEEGFFSLATSLDFARKALELGIKSKIHCDELSDLKSSEYFISMGARSIDHLQKINKTAVAMLGSADTVSTLMPATSFYLNLEFANARKLIDAGACLALATDFNPGTAPCSSMSFTHMLAGKDLKMNAAEIFAASTYNAAKALGREKGLGVLAPQKIANLNFYQASSLEEIFYSWIKPAHVVNRGEYLL